MSATDAATVAAVLAEHTGVHQCVGGWFSDNEPSYRGTIATHGACPTATLIRALTAAPIAQALAAVEAVARVEALAEQRGVLLPKKFRPTPTENFVAGYQAAQTDLRAALRPVADGA